MVYGISEVSMVIAEKPSKVYDYELWRSMLLVKYLLSDQDRFF